MDIKKWIAIAILIENATSHLMKQMLMSWNDTPVCKVK